MSQEQNPSTEEDKLTLRQKLQGETATIRWSELQRFFAQGSVLWLARDLDLVETAELFATDNSESLKAMLTAKTLAKPSNDQARQWFADDALLWSVVVAPFVLVQEMDTP